MQTDVELVPVTDLVADDLIDLEGDPWADPDHDQVGHECIHRYEYAVVGDDDDRPGERIGSDYLLFLRHDGCVAFPREHRVKRVRQVVDPGEPPPVTATPCTCGENPPCHAPWHQQKKGTPMSTPPTREEILAALGELPGDPLGHNRAVSWNDGIEHLRRAFPAQVEDVFPSLCELVLAPDSEVIALWTHPLPAIIQAAERPNGSDLATTLPGWNFANAQRLAFHSDGSRASFQPGSRARGHRESVPWLLRRTALDAARQAIDEEIQNEAGAR